MYLWVETLLYIVAGRLLHAFDCVHKDVTLQGGKNIVSLLEQPENDFDRENTSLIRTLSLPVYHLCIRFKYTVCVSKMKHGPN